MLTCVLLKDFKVFSTNLIFVTSHLVKTKYQNKLYRPMYIDFKEL